MEGFFCKDDRKQIKYSKLINTNLRVRLLHGSLVASMNFTLIE